MLRVARCLVRLASVAAPPERRDRMRREWEAELLAEARAGRGGWRLVAAAVGAFADARAQRSLVPYGIPWKRRSGDAMAGLVSGWIREGRVAVRSLLRAPGYTTVAVLTLAVGLGGTAAIYTLLDRVVLDPLPYPEAERLVRLTNRVPGVAPDERWHLSPPQYVHLTERSRTLEKIGLSYGAGAILQTDVGPDVVTVAVVTVETLELIGARAHLGRVIGEDDDRPGAPAVAMLSHGFWTRAFGADPDVIGRVLGPVWTADEPATVVGVLAPGVALPEDAGTAVPDVWTALRVDPSPAVISRSHVFPAIARLAPGADAAAVEREIAALTPQLMEAYPQPYPQAFFDRYGLATEATPLKDAVVGDRARILWILGAAVGLTLLVAYANVANLFVVRFEARRRELAVRSALGARSESLVGYLLAEAWVVSIAGALLALAVAAWAVPALTALAPADLPRVQGIGVGRDTVLLTLSLAAAVGVALALQPILSHGLGGGRAALADSGRGSSAGRSKARVRSALVAGQMALALVLAVSATLLVGSMRALRSTDIGIDPDGVLVVQVNAVRGRYPDDAALWAFYRQVTERVRALPGVTAVGMSSEIPIAGDYGCTVQGFEDPEVYARLEDPGTRMTTCAGQTWATPGYFESLSIPVLEGRSFEAADLDDPARASVVVSRAFAERFWPGERAIGKGVAASGRTIGPYYHVVGVVGDVPVGSVDGEAAIAVYYPVVHDPAIEGDMSWWWPGSMSLTVRTAGVEPASVVPAIRDAIHELDPNVPLTNVREMRQIVAASMARLSFTSLLLGAAAATALLLAAVGLYGVVSYAVTRRTREIGMRMAIGARPTQVERMVVAQSMGWVALGLAVGAFAAFFGTRVLEGLLYGVAATDPRAFLGAAGLLTAVALLASWIPARRAARVDPSVALREG